MSSAFGDVTSTVEHLLTLAQAGLPAMYNAESRAFAQTVRCIPSATGPRIVAEGTNLRYAAMVALGLSRLPEEAQRRVLSGITAAELTRALAARGHIDQDPGAVALAAWAAAEVDRHFDDSLFERLAELLESGVPLPTVDVAWMLSAAVTARLLGDTSLVTTRASERLMQSQGAQGIFPHALPRETLGRWRAHVGCYADQVYPIQALARLFAATGDHSALDAANRCAARICELQGPDGQWWWHYDVRDGEVVEGFPVYSVHQHAMGPMALFELLEVGGTDHRREVALGLRWLTTHPEVVTELVDNRHQVVWRKVGRREPKKAVRKLAAVTTSARPGLRLPGLDAAFPATEVDYECRPYELGWLLYAWLGAGVATCDIKADGEVRSHV